MGPEHILISEGCPPDKGGAPGLLGPGFLMAWTHTAWTGSALEWFETSFHRASGEHHSGPIGTPVVAVLKLTGDHELSVCRPLAQEAPRSSAPSSLLQQKPIRVPGRQVSRASFAAVGPSRAARRGCQEASSSGSPASGISFASAARGFSSNGSPFWTAARLGAEPEGTPTPTQHVMGIVGLAASRLTVVAIPPDIASRGARDATDCLAARSPSPPRSRRSGRTPPTRSSVREGDRSFSTRERNGCTVLRR